MMTQEFDGKWWVMVETNSLSEFDTMLHSLLRANVPCLVEAREDDQVDRFLPKYAITVPPENKYDLLQVYQSVCLEKQV